METILYPAPQKLFRAFITAALVERAIVLPHIGTANPKSLPTRWLQYQSHGGPRGEGGATWKVQYQTRYYDKDDDLGEDNATLIHQLMLDAAGVLVTLPGGSPFPWIVQAKHVSGPVNLTDADLPEMQCYQSAVRWSLCPIP